MTTLCCKKCMRNHQRDTYTRMALGEPWRPCQCSCHFLRLVEPEPARGVVIGVLMVVVPWSVAAYVIWRCLS